MGTNFYWVLDDAGRTPLGEEMGEEPDDMDPRYHLGKRSAAGRYCWDCRVSLCRGGEARVHWGVDGWYDACPRCGGRPVEGGYNPAYVELGFAGTPQPPAKLTGVQGASSFSWAQDPDAAIACCAARLWDEVVADEYGRRYTGQAFLWMLDAACPIRFTDSVGRRFC